MSQQSELLRRLRGMPADRRAELLSRLDGVSPGARTAPLSYRQEQLWLFDKVSPSSRAYGLGFAFHLDGPLDREALRQALDDLHERHSVLRSVFPHEHEGGVQVVQQARPAVLSEEPCTENELTHRLHHLVATSLATGFDLNAEPPVRWRLLRVSADRHVLVLVSHHLVMDARSAGVLLDDLAEAYRARAAGEPSRHPAPSRHFGEYASAQRERTGTPQAQRDAEFWQRALAAWENTEISADHARPRVLDLTAEVVEVAASGEIQANVRKLAENLDVSERDVLLGAFFALVSRHVSATDLTIGLPYQALDGLPSGLLVGDCGNLLPLRVELDEHASFADTVRRVAAHRAEAEQHGSLPFRLILDGLRLEPDPSRLPLAQLGFQTGAEAIGTATAGALHLRAEQIETGASAFELALETRFDDRDPAVLVRYATALYEQSTARRLAERYLALLAEGCAVPDRRLGRLSVTAEEERERILAEWNAPIGHRPPELLHRRFAEVAAAHPDRIALGARGGEISYRELDHRTSRLAHHLVAQGVRPGECVPVLLPRGPAAVEAVLAVLKAGAAYVPIDSGQPADRVRTVLADCGARTVLADPQAEQLSGLPGLTVIPVDTDTTGLPDTPPEIDLAPESLAYVIYTSGSTGRPKGVLIEHRNATGFIRNVQEMFGLGPEDRVLQFASVGFDVSVFEIFAALLSGARLYVVDDEERSSLDTVDRLMTEQRITVIDLPPAIMELLAPERYADLRVAFVGGEAFSGELTTRWARHCAFTNGYGPTETTVTVVAKQCEGHWTGSPPMGRAMTNHRAYVLDAELGLLPAGAVGELAVAGLGVARGYLGRPDLTAERFRPDPYGPPGSRMYLTGDLAGWRADGDLVFRGRADRQVKVRGVRIELGDVEAAIQSLPEVARAVADVAVDPHRGTLLVAYVVAAEGADLKLDAVRSALGHRLPPTMVPSVLVPVDEVPLTRSGKVDRRALPAVEFDAPDLLGTDDLADATATERTVATEVFGPLLGARVGKHVNFFALGGTSLQAIRIAPRVKAVFGVEIPISEFFAAPTAAGLARIIDETLAREAERRELLAAALDLVEGLGDEEIADLSRSRFGDE
ncbi:amino acid adenylation domain-containing protein [Kitasatospora sp. NPDC059673]|uniref:non-ribosomal peptide synthetase n=1 Tax=Kitasatospora sp. NPDC059673 TaxID=3346901 RepID=UPI0036BB855A